MVNVRRRVMLVSAFLIALVIFLGGLYAGFLLDSYRIDDTDSQIIDLKLNTEGFIVERDFFDVFEIKDCDLLNERIGFLGEDLVKLGQALSRYDLKKMSSSKEYDLLKRKYFLLELEVYTLRKEMTKTCLDNSNVILFFYNTERNQESLNQGYALDTLVKQEKNVTIFSFDIDFDENAIRSLIKYYNVTVVPTTVLNFEEKFEGYIPPGVLLTHFKK